MESSDLQLKRALIDAAEALLGRSLTDPEVNDLINRFNQATGTFRDRAQEALRGFTGLDESEIRTKSASSDNTDRAMRDLENTLKDRKK